MIQYDLVAPNRACARTGRELKPGEPIFSVLYDRQGQWVREEIAAEAWTGPPAEAFSFWRTVIRDEKRKGPPKLNPELLWECFLRSEGQPEPKQQIFRYVLALLLMRKKRLKLEEVQREGEADWLRMKETGQKTEHRVLDPKLTDTQLADVEREIEQLMQ